MNTKLPDLKAVEDFVKDTARKNTAEHIKKTKALLQSYKSVFCLKFLAKQKWWRLVIGEEIVTTSLTELESFCDWDLTESDLDLLWEYGCAFDFEVYDIDCNGNQINPPIVEHSYFLEFCPDNESRLFVDRVKL